LAFNLFLLRAFWEFVLLLKWLGLLFFVVYFRIRSRSYFHLSAAD